MSKFFEWEKTFEKGCFSSNSPFPKLFNYQQYLFIVKVFVERGVIGEREPFFQKGFLSPKILLLNQMIKSWGISAPFLSF